MRLIDREKPGKTNRDRQRDTVQQISILLCDCLILSKPVIAVTYFVCFNKFALPNGNVQTINTSIDWFDTICYVLEYGDIINRRVFYFVKLKVNKIFDVFLGLWLDSRQRKK